MDSQNTLTLKNAKPENASKTFGFFAFAVLIEAMITYINQFFVNGEFCWQMVLGLLLGVFFSIAYNLDIPSYFNLKSKLPFVGSVITGVLISRGANYVFDIIDKIGNIWELIFLGTKTLTKK